MREWKRKLRSKLGWVKANSLYGQRSHCLSLRSANETTMATDQSRNGNRIPKPTTGVYKANRQDKIRGGAQNPRSARSQAPGIDPCLRWRWPPAGSVREINFDDSASSCLNQRSRKRKLLTQSKMYVIETSSTSAIASVRDVRLAPEPELAPEDGKRVRESCKRYLRASLRYLS